MASNHPDQPGQRTRPKSMRGNHNLVAFLAIQKDVRALLEAGHAVKAVWKIMRENQRIGIGYEVFLHYVHRLIWRPDGDPGSNGTGAGAGADTGLAPRPGANVQPVTKGDSAPMTAMTPVAAKTAAISGFTFNPVPNIEELF